MWAIVGNVSGWVSGIAAACTIIGFVLLYRKVLMSLSATETALGSGVVEDFTDRIRFWLPIGVGVGVVALALAKFASLMRLQLRTEQ